MPNPLHIGIIVFIYGLCIGSFLNVCIFRIPASLSLIKPSSTCPKCKAKIKSYDNIPVISYIFLGGKCRVCRIPISIRYPLIELFTGIMWFLTFAKFGLSINFFIYVAFISTLIVITFIDIDLQIIPDAISLPGIPIFFILALFLPGLTLTDAALKSFYGIIAGGGSLLSIALLYEFIAKKEGMGFGDIKLLAMIGALIGFQGVLFTIFISSALGTVIGLFVMLITRNNLKLAIPFGPFLSAGAVVYLFYGETILIWEATPFRSPTSTRWWTRPSSSLSPSALAG